MPENAQDAMKAFFRKAMADPDLQVQLKTAASLPEDDVLDRVAQIAGDAGFDFTAADLAAFSRAAAGGLTLVEEGELSDQQLDEVAAGCWVVKNNQCWLGYSLLCPFLYEGSDCVVYI